MRIVRGFTLIELLVVIAIIGLLSSVVLASLNTARAKARDAQRLSDLHQLQTALSLYYADNGSYPNSTYLELSSIQADWNTAANPLYAALIPKYIAKLPLDPKNTVLAGQQVYEDASNYVYYYTTYDPNTYVKNYDLAGRLENSGNPSSCGVRDPAHIDGSGFCNMHTYVGSGSNLGGYSGGGNIVVDH